MEYLEYFKRDYVEDEVDCWTLMQDIFRDKHDIRLPHQPVVFLNEREKAEIIKSNTTLEELEEPQQGAIIHFDTDKQHCGYCINKNYYIHATRSGVKIDKIPTSYMMLKNINFYKVLKNGF